jgi:endonuclease/exonuclease/phosphatase family metal-dependent hydrolase
MRKRLVGLLGAIGAIGALGCGSGTDRADAGSMDARRPARDAYVDLAASLDAAAFSFDWSCEAPVAPTLDEPAAEPPVEDCSAGIWPDLPLTNVCPTVTDATRTDPDTGLPLPPEDDRTLPLTIPVSESGSYLPAELPATWPSALRVVAWNMEYSSNLDAQIDTLVEDPEFRAADVYLLSEVDRCSTRNGVQRAARLLAQRVGGAYVYGIEFVELSIGRDVGGDTGQAIVSRRPLRGASLLCHSAQSDWFSSDDEPRLGQRVALSAEVPVGDTWARVYAVHFESVDIVGTRRAQQVRETLEDAEERACGRPVVIAGDFNTWYPTAPERVAMRSAGFTDVFETLGQLGTATHDSGRHLDYVYVRDLGIRGGTIRSDVQTSDHRPMWVDLEL